MSLYFEVTLLQKSTNMWLFCKKSLFIILKWADIIPVVISQWIFVVAKNRNQTVKNPLVFSPVIFGNGTEKSSGFSKIRQSTQIMT